MVIGSLDHKFFMCHLPPPLKSVSRELTTSWNKNLSMNLWHRVSKWIIFPANRVSMLKMSEQRTECAGFSCMESTEHWRSEAAHVYISLSWREEVWHDISPGSHTAGGRRSLKADSKTKTYFTLALLIFESAFEQYNQKKMGAGFELTSTFALTKVSKICL